MALAPGALREASRLKHDEAVAACKERRYFEAVQLINGSLEAFERSLGAVAGQGLLLADPAKFVEAAQGALDEEQCEVLASLYATRADTLMNLGGLRRAVAELSVAAKLAPADARVVALQEECEALKRALEQAPSALEKRPAPEAKVPAHILTGFLGSGKTTLLNHILHEMHGKKLAIIENEFGEIGIDDKLITAGREELGEENIIEMNNGCICCTVRGDLIKGLKSILQRTMAEGKKLDGVIIETTGLADPAPVAQTFFADEYIQAHMVLDGIITVVDAKHALQHLREERPEGVENEAVEQIAFADRILLNKIDLVDAETLEEVESEIRKINRFCPIVCTQQSKIDVDHIIGIRGFSLDRVLESDGGFLDDAQDHQHDASVTSVGIECQGECDNELLNKWVGTLLREKGVDIFRMKGVLAVKGCEQRFVYQGIHMLFSGEPQGDWKADEPRTNKLVFIGRNLNREELVSGFRATLAQ